jgi:hypothetical protein
MKTAIKLLLGATALALTSQANAIVIDDWTSVGNTGTGIADGHVTLSPFAGSTQYGWVSTASGVSGVGLSGIGGSGSATNGSVITSSLFAADAGDSFQFFFNYVTSDGAGYADYGWARLLNEDLSQAALLFTARTTPGGDTVPGFSMPTPAATLTPENTPIIAGGPVWSPLNGSSGSCYDAGCGYTDWIQATYEILASGNYFLEIGAVNWSDTAYDSGMAFDGATINGVVIGDPDTGTVPVPATIALLTAGLMGFSASRRKA